MEINIEEIVEQKADGVLKALGRAVDGTPDSKDFKQKVINAIAILDSAPGVLKGDDGRFVRNLDDYFESIQSQIKACYDLLSDPNCSGDRFRYQLKLHISLLVDLIKQDRSTQISRDSERVVLDSINNLQKLVGGKSTVGLYYWMSDPPKAIQEQVSRLPFTGFTDEALQDTEDGKKFIALRTAIQTFADALKEEIKVKLESGNEDQREQAWEMFDSFQNYISVILPELEDKMKKSRTSWIQDDSLFKIAYFDCPKERSPNEHKYITDFNDRFVNLSSKQKLCVAAVGILTALAVLGIAAAVIFLTGGAAAIAGAGALAIAGTVVGSAGVAAGAGVGAGAALARYGFFSQLPPTLVEPAQAVSDKLDALKSNDKLLSFDVF